MPGPTPITAQGLLRCNYTVSGKHHRIDLWVPGIAGGPPYSSAVVLLTMGANAGTPMSTVQGTLANDLKAALNTGDTIDSFTLFSVQASPYLLTPLYTDTPAVSGTASPPTVLGSSVRFVMKHGVVKGTFVFNEANTGLTYPSRNPAPTTSGTDVFSKVWNLHSFTQYFSLRDQSFPTAVFKVSAQFNRKLLKIRGLR